MCMKGSMTYTYRPLDWEGGRRMRDFSSVGNRCVLGICIRCGCVMCGCVMCGSVVCGSVVCGSVVCGSVVCSRVLGMLRDTISCGHSLTYMLVTRASAE